MTLDTIALLSDAEAIRILRTITKAHINAAGETPELTGAEAEALVSEFGAEPAAPAAVADGEMARQALTLLAQDDQMRMNITRLAADSGHATVKYAMDPLQGVLLTTAVIMVLKTHVEFKRDKDGKWTLKIISKPLDQKLLKDFVGKFINWFKPGV